METLEDCCGDEMKVGDVVGCVCCGNPMTLSEIADGEAICTWFDGAHRLHRRSLCHWEVDPNDIDDPIETALSNA